MLLLPLFSSSCVHVEVEKVDLIVAETKESRKYRQVYRLTTEKQTDADE
jgi:hypothetical protein